MRCLFLQEEKAQKLLTLNARIEEVIAQKLKLIDEKRDMMNLKMARAELKRQEHIDGIRKKAREEVRDPELASYLEWAQIFGSIECFWSWTVTYCVLDSPFPTPHMALISVFA